MVTDVVHIASRLPWWGALATGFTAYLIFSVGFAGYMEGHIADQAGSQFYVVIEARYGRLARLFNWIGIACFVAGLFFAVRNQFLFSRVGGKEKGLVSFLSKLIGRSVD